MFRSSLVPLVTFSVSVMNRPVCLPLALVASGNALLEGLQKLIPQRAWLVWGAWDSAITWYARILLTMKQKIKHRHVAASPRYSGRWGEEL